MNIKNILLAVVSAVGGYIVSFLGGVDTVLKALVIFMIVDYLTGLAVAFFFHKSNKTPNGGASSKEGFKGIVKKICMILLVGLSHVLDVIMDVDYIRSITIMFFLANEGLSVLENVGLMGVKYNKFLIKALEALREHAEMDNPSGTDVSKREGVETLPYGDDILRVLNEVRENSTSSTYKKSDEGEILRDAQNDNKESGEDE